MDFRLSIGFDLPRESLRKLLYDMICEVLFVELINYEADVLDHSGRQKVRINCTYFSMSIDLDDEDEYLERFREMNFEAYGVTTNVLISIQFMTRTFEIGWLKMLELISKILKMNNLDVVIEDDTSYPLFKRIKGHLIINNNLDYRAWYLEEENLALLNYPYEEENFLKDNEGER